MPLILTDIDEVVLNWRAGFEAWCHKQPDIKIDPNRLRLHDHHKAEEWLGVSIPEVIEIIRRFHNSPEFEQLQPYNDAIQYIPKLLNLGYRFVAVTAIDDDPSVVDARTRNLRMHFNDAFSAVHCVGLMGNKKEVLSWYRPTYWIEDKPSNAKLGAELGHTAMLVTHPNNLNYEDSEVIRVRGWDDIHKMLNTLHGNWDSNIPNLTIKV